MKEEFLDILGEVMVFLWKIRWIIIPIAIYLLLKDLIYVEFFKKIIY